MRNLAIAYGNSRKARTYKNMVISYDELRQKLSNTIRTKETVEEYHNLPKQDRDAIKDKGGFVAGTLRNGRRNTENIVSRSMLTQDVDFADKDFLARYEMLYLYKSILYSTHSHTPEAPRYRIITPLTRDVTPEEYTALSRYVACELGIDYYDSCSFRPNQMMYLPTTSADGEFVYMEQDDKILNPDDIFAKHPEWKDCSTLPTGKHEEVVVPKTDKKQQDPMSKDGIVGAFCRAYGDIEAVIDKFLSDIYKPSVTPGRYDFIGGESTAGVVIYDGKFVFSHHATDPASNRLLNAFDLVRVHKFPDADEKKSFNMMSAFAVTLDEVKLQLAQDQFTADDNSSEENWQAQLEYDKQGRLTKELNNLVLIFRHDENLKCIAFNRHRDGVDANGKLPWTQMKPGWNDTDDSSLRAYLSATYKLYTQAKTKDALLTVATERAYHPIKEYLESLPEWDCVPRVDTLYIDYFGAEDNSYTRAVSRKSMVAAVARIYNPGTKFDSVPILNGPQGIGKSTFFAKLAGKWFSDSMTLTDMKDKSGPEKLQGYWILELGELAGMRKTDVETVKSFISRVDDKYRASYGQNVENHPRQCIIVGSTNAENGFLRDITGNRRFWPIRAYGNSKKKSWQMTKEDVEQIWAETLVLYRKGEKLYLESDEATLASEEQDAAMETDEREGLVRDYLATLLPDNWEDMSLYARKDYLDKSVLEREGTNQRKYVCNMEIWVECFGRDAANMKPADSYAIAAIMKKIGGWSKGTRHVFKLYGRQRSYVFEDKPSGNE